MTACFTLHQQFTARLLAQVLQHVQLLVELFSSAADAGFLDLAQPLGSMTGIVDVPTGTGNGPAAIHRFQAIHDSRQIFDDGQKTSRQLPQHAHARLAMVNRFETIEAQQVRQLASVDPVAFVAVFQQSVLPRIAHH